MKAIRYNTILALTIVLCTFAASPAGAQWVQTNGPTGASVRAICASGSNFFAGTTGGVYYTTNNGSNWVLSGVAHMQIMALAVSGSTLYAGGDGGIHRSDDLGMTWTEVSTGLTNTDVRSLCIKDSYVFAGTAAGVFRANLSGGSWTAMSSTALSGEMVFALTASGSFVVAGTMRGGIYRTNNYGSTWSKTNTGLTNLSVRALYRSSSGSYLYAGGEGGVHRSTNNGKDWTAMNNGLFSSAWNAIPIVQGLSGTGAKVYAATYNGGVYYSSDRAANWNTTTLQQGSTHSIAVISSNVLAGTHNNGVHRTANNGSTWTAVNNGFRASAVAALASNGGILYAGGFTPLTVSKSTDEGATWTGTLSCLPRTLFSTGSTLFAGTSGQGLYRSNDNGATWAQTTNMGGYITALIAKGSYIFAGASNPFVTSQSGVYRSGDNGATWTQVNNGLTYKRVYAFAVIGTNLFTGTSDGGVFISTDDGATWAQTNSGLTNTNVIALAASGTNLYAATYGGGVFFSNNNGASWSAVNSGLTNLYANSFAVTGGKVFVGTQDGVFLTTNNGMSWTNVGTGLSGSTSIGALEIMGTTLYAGTGGTGVWKRPLGEMIPIPKSDVGTVATDLRLEQNYPNPFNPATTISYSIPADAAVQLRVYDALGREVAVLVNEMKSAGAHSVQFNAEGLTSGMYVYRLEAGSAVLSGKMTLMK